MSENTPYENLLRDVVNNTSYDLKLEISENFDIALNEIKLIRRTGETIKSHRMTHSVVNDYEAWKCNSPRELMCFIFLRSIALDSLNKKHETNV